MYRHFCHSDWTRSIGCCDRCDYSGYSSAAGTIVPIRSLFSAVAEADHTDHIAALAIEEKDWNCCSADDGDVVSISSVFKVLPNEIDRATACGIARMSWFIEILGPSRELYSLQCRLQLRV